MTENNYRAGALTNDQSAILIACAHRLDEVGSQYLAEELRSLQRDLLAASPVQQPAAAPIPYDGLTEEFTDEVARLANDAPGIREAVSAALENCNAIIAPQGNVTPAPADERAPCMCSGLGPCEQRTDGSCRRERAAAPAPADERAAYHFHRFVDGVEMAEGVLIERAPTLEAASKEAVRCCEKRPMTVLVHAPTWAGTLCGGALANRAASANETGAPIGWAWISPTGHVSRFTADFDGKHDQLVQGWKVRPVAFCDSVANETVPKWVFDNLVNTLQPAWDYIQTHQDQFNAQAGDDKNAIMVEFFLRAASANETQTCSHQWTWADGKCADCGMTAQQPAAQSELTLAERIAHVGGRITEGGYVEFGSAMAVDALIQHALRDARASANETGAERVGTVEIAGGRVRAFTFEQSDTPDGSYWLYTAPAQAAEPVAWQYRPIVNGKPYPWIECTKEAAERLRAEDFRGTHDVRDLFDSPQPPAQADAREGLTDEQRSTLESLARTSTPYEQEVLRSILATHPGQSEPRRSENPTGIGYDTPPEELERILAQGETRAEVTVDQPSLANPLTPYGMLVRALRIVAQTSLHDMGQALLLSPSKLSAMEFGREPVTPEIVREIGTYFESLGIHNMRPALQFAIDAATTGDQS
ncbi:hypothetical protein KDW57_23140 [Burkholderia multivorans]|uniref:hypothetical protein n=1 Tax=Burkholderia TaxID=32008 RepID=UPI001BA0D6BD|nr:MULTISPECIES: hypothetical protein [Burkholderia]MBR8021200.1 hypothetical protein [Burkholderia multivorans]HEF4732694.1 hypothetical protein [Burkholderia multivorans]